MKRQDGMTLVELMVSLSIILIVMAVATAAYLKILKSYKTQSKISQTYMANLTGLELLRYDIQMAGYGLPASLTAGATYNEAVNPASGVIPTGYSPAALNDATTSVPRPVVILPNGGLNGSDVLAIKSSVAGINPVSKKWSMIRMVGAARQVKSWGVAASDFVANDRFIVLNASGALMPAVAGSFACYTFNPTGKDYYIDANDIASGLDNKTVFLMYGLDDGADPTTVNHRMPFNRVDYYLDTPTAAYCAAGTYTLYRSVINQSDGLQSNPTPLIDCVRDFQVAAGLDTDATLDGNVNPDGWRVNLTGLTAQDIRDRVRELRVFILYHEGTGDIGRTAEFRSSGFLNLGDQDIAHSVDASYPVPPNIFQTLSTAALSGNPSLSSFQMTGANAGYRWKVLQIAVKPMNLK